MGLNGHNRRQDKEGFGDMNEWKISLQEDMIFRNNSEEMKTIIREKKNA